MMSEQTTQTSTSRSQGNVFTKKIGPLPMWSWMAIILGLVLVYSFYKKSQGATSSANQSAAEAAGNAAGGVDSSLVPQFVNQVYDQDTPPAAPNVTVPVQVNVPPTAGTQPTHMPVPKPVKTPPVHQYQAPTGLKTTKATGTSIKVSWKDLTGPTPPASYTVAVYSKANKLLSQTTVNAPDAKGGNSTTTITGLPANSQGLQVHVWGNGGQLAPPHASSTVNI
jgi:hypothetical protein